MALSGSRVGLSPAAAPAIRYPLLRHDGAAAFARRGGEPITAERFLRDALALAGLLPSTSRHVVNLCRDRYRFAVGFAATLCREQVTLLPPSGTPAVLARVAADYPDCCALTDGGEEPGAMPFLRYPSELRHGGATPAVPVFPADQPAAVLFTSGSTGAPQPHPRSWGALVRSTLAAGQRLGLAERAGAAVLGTVPHQHSYGLESLIMLALQNRLELQAGWPFYPDDVRRQLEATAAPRLLVTTPAHLRVLVAQASRLPPVALVLSATAPLSTELAVAAESFFEAPLHEIYGCSEAGQIASRRTVAGPLWDALDGVSLEQDRNGWTWVSGPSVAAETRLTDVIELADDTRFELHGRRADVINVAGKRSSLSHLNHQLTAIEGVEDGFFVMPDEEADAETGVVRRLTAFVVAPGRAADQVLAALRTRIDAAFLPRPLHLVDALPRNALGKLTQADIRELVGRAATRGSGE